MAKQYQHVEHAILTLVLKHGDQRGYATTLPTLANILRQTFPEITNLQIIDTLKRLEPQYITLWKYGSAFARLVRYSREEIDDEYLFGEGDFCLQRTPHTDPRAQELAQQIKESKAPTPVTTPISEEGCKARFDRWEELGLDRVKADLVHNGGRGVVGGPHDVQDLAWEWVRLKEAEIAAAAELKVPATVPALIAQTRIDKLRGLPSTKFDFSKLIRLCEEINIAYGEDCHCATAMLTRAVLDHVPPIFSKANFDDVANHYGGRSFKEAMRHLNDTSRSVADGHLHEQISKRVTLPTAQQVDCRQQLDLLLAEIVKVS
jgi:hypothetical protein